MYQNFLALKPPLLEQPGPSQVKSTSETVTQSSQKSIEGRPPRDVKNSKDENSTLKSKRVSSFHEGYRAALSLFGIYLFLVVFEVNNLTVSFHLIFFQGKAVPSVVKDK